MLFLISPAYSVPRITTILRVSDWAMRTGPLTPTALASSGVRRRRPALTMVQSALKPGSDVPHSVPDPSAGPPALALPCLVKSVEAKGACQACSANSAEVRLRLKRWAERSSLFRIVFDMRGKLLRIDGPKA